MAFKDMLKFFREREGWSQGELAAKLGLSTSTISMYEVGKREPNFEIEEKIADLFNTDLNTLRGNDIELHQRVIYSPEEERLISAYRSAPEGIRDSVCKLLDVKRDEKKDASETSADMLA